MTSIIAIPSVIYLVLITSHPFEAKSPVLVIQEMPTMHVCESIGEWVVNHMPPTIYTCIESPRDE